MPPCLHLRYHSFISLEVFKKKNYQSITGESLSSSWNLCILITTDMDTQLTKPFSLLNLPLQSLCRSCAPLSNTSLKPILYNTVATSYTFLLSTWSMTSLRCAVSVKHTLDFKDLILKISKISDWNN